MGDARSGTIGNFWVDLFRGSFRLLLIGDGNEPRNQHGKPKFPSAVSRSFTNVHVRQNSADRET